MSVPDPHLIPKPRGISRRGWVLGVIISLVVVALYATVAVLYNVEGGSTFVGDPPSSVAGIQVEVEPVAVDPQRNTSTVHVAFRSEGPDIADGDGRLVANTRILIETSLGSQEFRIPAGTALSQQEITVGLNGEEALYPFDTHDGFLEVTIDTYDKNADGSFTSTGTVYSSIAPMGSATGWGINGWDTLMTASDQAVSSSVTFSFSRAFSTRIFAIVLLVLVVVLAGVALIVGLLTSTRRRRAEVGLMAYAASLLFALPALRQYMPNAPPIGALLDIYVYLWVIVTAIVAVTLVVTSWIRQTRENLIVERQQAKEIEAEAATHAQTGD